MDSIYARNENKIQTVCCEQTFSRVEISRVGNECPCRLLYVLGSALTPPPPPSVVRNLAEHRVAGYFRVATASVCAA